MGINNDELIELVPVGTARHSSWATRWLPLLLGRARLIAASAVIATALGVILAFVVPVRYESEARLLPSDNSDAGASRLLRTLGGMADAAVLAGYNGSELDAGSDSGRFIGILRSRTAADSLIDQFDLMKIYGTRKRDVARHILEQKTSIVADRKTGQIVLRVTDNDAQRAKNLAKAYIDVLNTLNARMNTTAAHREREFLEQRMKEVGEELQIAAQDLSKFSRKTSLITVGEQEKAMVEGVARLQTALIEAKAQLSGLETIYSDDYYLVREARGRVARLSQELQALRGSDTADSKSEMFPSIRELPELGVTYADLYKRVKTLAGTSELLARQLELVKTDEAKELPVIRVLDEPEVPISKSWPPRKLIVVIALLMGIVGSVVWILARQAWNDLSQDHDLKVACANVRRWWVQKQWRTVGNQDPL